MITKGNPIALLVASKSINIPHPPKINSTGKLNIMFDSYSDDKRYWNYDLIIPTDSLNSSVSKRIHDFNNQHIYWQYIEDNCSKLFDIIINDYFKFGPSFNIDNIDGYIYNNNNVNRTLALTLLYENNIKLFNVRHILKENNAFIIKLQHDKNATIEPFTVGHSKFSYENRHYHTNYYLDNNINQEYTDKNEEINSFCIELYDNC